MPLIGRGCHRAVGEPVVRGDPADAQGPSAPSPAVRASGSGSGWMTSPTVAAGEDGGECGVVLAGDHVVFRAGSSPADRRETRGDPPFNALM